MTLYYSDDHVQLWHGDCREITAWLEADVLVTDPPYGRAWKQGRRGAHATGRASAARDGIAGDGDTSVRDAALSLWGDRPCLAFGSSLGAPPVGTRQILVWRKGPDSGVFGSIAGWRRDWEPIYLMGPWEASPPCRSGVIQTVSGVASYTTGRHPHAKPVLLLETLISTCPPGVIADPFAGAGATLIAAKLQGRKAIGVEIDERYCEIAARRLAQDSLFGEAS